MSRMLSYYKSQLKSAAKSGPQYVTIDYCKILNPSGYVVSYKNDNIEHEEYYDVKNNFSDFLKINKVNALNSLIMHDVH